MLVNVKSEIIIIILNSKIYFYQEKNSLHVLAISFNIEENGL